MTPSTSDADLAGRFFRLAFINIVSNVTVPLAGLVDTAMLGHLPEIRFLAGAALASVLFDYVYWTFNFLRMSTTGLTAQALGRDDRRGIYVTLYRSFSLALLISGGVLALHAPFRELGFWILQGEPGVEAAGRSYFAARIWGAPATLCNFVFLGWFLGREQARQALAMTVVANLANIAFNYLFIVRLGMAAFGAGLATAIAQYVALATALAMFALQGRHVRWDWAAVFDRTGGAALFKLNRDILLRTLMLVTSFAVFTSFSSAFGTAVLAANSILLRVSTLAAYLIDGAAFASETLAGVFRGAGHGAGLRRLFRFSLFSGFGFAIAVLALFFAFQRPFFELMTVHAELIDLGLRYAPWLVPTLLFGSLAYMYDGLFLGLTEGRRLRNAMLVSTLAVFLPIACVALVRLDNHLLWAAMATFMAARAVTLWRSARQLPEFSGAGSVSRT